MELNMEEDIDIFLRQQHEQAESFKHADQLYQNDHVMLFDSSHSSSDGSLIPPPQDNTDIIIPGPTKDESGKDVYLCDSCGALFAYSYSLIAHKRHKCHAGKGEFKCELCHKRFNFPSQLQRHMPTHTGEKPFQCRHCPKAFNESSNLKQHMLIHTDQKPFCCDFEGCDKRFRSASNLKVHLRTHTKERPYICEYTGCGKRFVSAGDLKRHFRIHTKERPYVCQYCGKSFIQGPYLNIHIRSHTKEKPYTCSHCGKAFSRTSTLKIHLRLHTGENASSRKKVSRCSPCNKTFENHNALQMHNSLCHPKNETGPPSTVESELMDPTHHQPHHQPQPCVALSTTDNSFIPQAYRDPLGGLSPLNMPYPPPLPDSYSYMQSLMYDCEVPCGTLPNGQTVPLIGKNASIIRPRAKRAENSGVSPLSPDFIPQRDKMGMAMGMVPGIPPPQDFYNPPPNLHLPDVDGGNKIPPLVPVPLPPPVNPAFGFFSPMMGHEDPAYSMYPLPPPTLHAMAPMGMEMPSHLSLPELQSELVEPDPSLSGMLDMRAMDPVHSPNLGAAQFGSVFKPYSSNMDMHPSVAELALPNTNEADAKPLI